MTERLGLIEEIPCNCTESWAISYSDIPHIPELGVDLSTYGGYVSQGFYRELDTPGAITMATDGLSRCSGLVVFEPETRRVLVGHLEPEFGGMIDRSVPRAASKCLEDMNSSTHKEVILIYGDISQQQTVIEDDILACKYGSVSLRRIMVNSGNQRTWGFVISKSTGEIKTFTRSDQTEIATYSLFPAIIEG